MNEKHSRRKFIVAGSQTILMATGISFPYPAFAENLLKTPSMSRGPFYPDQLPLDQDNDLVKVNDRHNEAIGQIAHIYGRVLDVSGKPISNAQIEIWQCDAKGRYIHTWDAQRGPRDLAFQGFGRTLSDQNGHYRFRTIKPVPYSGRTPHIHVKVWHAGSEILTTQLYLPDHADNKRDWLYQRLPSSKRELVTMNFIAGPREPEAIVDLLI